MSFASPCILPLIPGFVGYLSGMSAADAGPRARTGSAATRRAAPSSGRVVLGSVLFVLGFTAVFVLLGVMFAAAGARLHQWIDPIMRVMGVVVILMGLAFLGHVPFLQREARVHMNPRYGVAGAPLLGATFALGWTPCIGPTLAAVLALSFGGADPGRGALLALAYSLGLGLPFVLVAVAFTRSPRLHQWVRRHRTAISRVGGAVLIVVGLLLVTGVWGTVMNWLQGSIAGFEPVL